MASVGSVLSEEQLLCPICLDVFTQPVSTPCGHNFCRDCIQGYWRSIPVSHCPMCKQTFYRRPELKVNTFISELAAQFRRTVEAGADDERASATSSRSGGEVPCDVCNGKSVKALKSCLDCLASFCETHLAPHQILGTFKRHRLIDPVMNMQDRVCQKHERLLELFCNTDGAYVCQDCVETDHRAHATVPIEAESRERRARLKEIDVEVQQKIQGRLQKIGEIRHAVELSRRNTERETEDSRQVFAAMLLCVQRGQAELVGAIEGKQREAERRAEGIIKDLEQETAELSRWSAELERLTNTDDHLHLLQRFPTIISATPPVTKEWSETAVESVAYVGTVRRAVRRVGSQLEEMLKAQVSRLCETEFQRVRLCEVDVTLDPDTAHPKLILSADGKQVHHGDHVTLGSGRINDNNPKRFYPGLSVLGKQGFTSGKFYYEVQVKGKTEWDVGVCLESVNRKGGDTLNPEGGYWAVGLRNHGKQYWALASPAPVRLPLGDKPQRVGLYVDVENGQVSFYNVASRSHIYTFTGHSFGERVFPYFNPRRNHGGVNSAPLIISPVVSNLTDIPVIIIV